MSVRIIKTSIVFIIAAIMFVVVQAAVNKKVYFPVIIYQLTYTITPSITGRTRRAASPNRFGCCAPAVAS